MLLMPTREREQCELVFPCLDEWLDLYLEDCRRGMRSPHTITHYSNALKRFSIWYTHFLPSGRLSRTSAREFVRWLAERKYRFDDHPGRPTGPAGLAPATVKRTVGVVRTFLRWLYREDYLERDCSHWFPLPKIDIKANRMMKPETLAALFQGAALGKNPVRDAAMIALLADTGLRRKELALLTVEQVQWLEPAGRGYLSRVTGKGNKVRDVPFSAAAGEVLHAWLEVRAHIVQSTPATDVLFIQCSGAALTPDSVYQVLRRTAKRAGVDDRVWNTHSMRHAFATFHWRTRRDTKTLSEILGHSSQKVTEDIYVHPVPDDLIEAHTSILAAGDVPVPDVDRLARPAPPSREELQTALMEMPNWVYLGKRFGLSDQGVRKLAKRYDLLELYYQRRRNR